MSSTSRLQLKEVELLIIHGKFKEALEMINEGLKNNKISEDDKLSLFIHKCESEFWLGNWKETLQLAELVLKKSRELENKLLQADALLWIAVSIFWDGDYDKSPEYFEKCSEVISTLTNLPEEEIAKRKAIISSWTSFNLIMIGDFERALELGKEAVSYAKASGYDNIISLCLSNLGESYIYLGDSKNAEDNLEMALKLASELENDHLIGVSYGYLAQNRWRHYRDYEQALDLFNKCSEIAEKTGCKSLYGFKTDESDVYFELYQLDRALEYLHTSLKYSPFGKHLKYARMGLIHFLKCDFEQALEYYLESMKTSEEINDRHILPFNLSNLVSISLELKKFDQAKEYLSQLKDLSEEIGSESIIRFYRFASISVLKATGNVNDLADAVNILNEFLAEEAIPPYERLDVLYSLLEIRLKELYVSTNEDNLKEVQKRLHHLEIEAEEQKQQWLLANVYRLQSQLSLVELDVNNAISLLDKAQTIADEINVELLKKEIQKDRDKIKQQLTMFQKFQKQQASISETVKIVSLENTVQDIKRETLLEERDEAEGKLTEYRKLFVLKI